MGNRDVGQDGFGSVTCIGVVLGGTRGKKNNNTFVPDPQPLPPGEPPGEYLAPPFLYSTCVDRDGDGLIRTSYGLNNRLEWPLEGSPQDEAVLHHVPTTPTFIHSVAVDRDNNIWVGSRNDGWQEVIEATTGAPITGRRFLYGAGGYGAVVDPYGVIWSPGYWDGQGLLHLPQSSGMNTLPGTAGGILPDTLRLYGIGIDPVTGDIWAGDYWYGDLWHFVQSGCTFQHAFLPLGDVGARLKGIVGDGMGNIWVAAAYRDPSETDPGRVVYRLRNTGQYLGRAVLRHPTIPNVTGKSPHGLCVDSGQLIWAVCFRPAEDGKYYAMRIDPTQGVDPDTENIVGRVVEAVDLGTFPSGRGPYNYSDLSGFVTLAATQSAGFWDFVEDSGQERMRWTSITADSDASGGAILIEVRAADQITDLPAWSFRPLNGASGVLPLEGLGIQGRYLEVRVMLLRDFGVAPGPVLKALCVAKGTPGTELRIMQHPQSAIVPLGESAVFNVTASGGGLSYQWFKDGATIAGATGPTLTIQNAQFANAGKYHVRVSDATGASLDSADARLHVYLAPPYPLYADVDNPEPTLGQEHPIVFTATMYMAPSIGPIYYQWRKNGVPISGAFGTCEYGNEQYTAEYRINPPILCEHSGVYSVVFASDFWKVVNWPNTRLQVTVKDSLGRSVPLVLVTPSYIQIADRNNPPTLTATTCFAAVCAQWYRISAESKQPIPEANSLQYTFPNPVRCEMLGSYMVEVFDEGRFPHPSNTVSVEGGCEP